MSAASLFGGPAAFEGGGSDARSARFMEAPLRMWSRNWMSTSRRKSWKVKGAECSGRMGVRASLCFPRLLGTFGGGGVAAALVAERVMTVRHSKGEL